MKAKLFIILALVVAVPAMIWFGFKHSKQKAALPAQIRSQASKAMPPKNSAVRFLPWNSIKMVTIGGEPPAKEPWSKPVRDDWSDIQRIIDGHLSFEERRKAISRLSSKLTDADWKALRGFLLNPASLDNGQLGQVLKNDLMDKLCLMNPQPTDLNGVLAQMYKNLLQNEVVRDYALQHLATLDSDLAQNGGQSVSREEKTDQKVLWDATVETGDSIAGTALLGLARISQKPDAGVDGDKLTATALKLANDATAGELTQITAYQVCAQLDIQEALPTIEAAAQNSQTISTQISAIGALGQIGGPNDIALLQNLIQGNNQRLQMPAQTAISRIEQRIHQT